MFQLAGQSDHIVYPVKVDFLDGNGKTSPKTFKAHFLRLAQSEIDELIEKSQAKEITDNDLVVKVFVGWDDVTDDQGQPVEFSPVMRDKLLEIYPVRPSVIAAWFESIVGAKRKN
jgi:hypothetical protein